MSLPESWLETTVGKVVLDIQPGFAQKPGEDDEGMTPQIRTHNISPEGKITLVGIKHVSASKKELERYKLAIGDVVFNNTNSEEWVGKTAVFDQEGEFVFSNHMTRLKVDTRLIHPYFLAGYLQFLWSIGYSKTRSKRWVSQAGIEGSTLTSFKLPLPTLAEQLRIIDILLQAKITSDLQMHGHDLVSLITKQRFVEMFGHPAENPKEFECFQFQEFGTLDRGISKHRPRDASHLFGELYPFIQTGNVANAGDWISTYTANYSEAGLAQSKLWPKGTLCITIAANIAKAAILEFDACFPDSVVGFTPAEDVFSEYVLYCLRFYQEYFEHRAPKSAQMNINLETLRTLRIPKPPKELQQEFAAFVREVRLLNRTITTQTEKISQLNCEVRIAAFTGELTANWREARQIEIDEAVIERDQILSEIGAKIYIRKDVISESEHSSQASGALRQWLVNELSEFQHEVWNMLRYEWRGSVLIDDPEVFDDFCTSQQTAWRMERFNASPNTIRRTLEQLAALGLIAKVSVPKTNSSTSQTEYMTAFRPLREDENTRLADVEKLRNALEPDNGVSTSKADSNRDN